MKYAAAVTVKLTAESERTLRVLAEVAGLTPSEYVRELIERDICSSRQRFELMQSIFADSGEKAR